MSGYSSKAEALSVIKETLNKGVSDDLPKGSKFYNVSAIFNEMFYTEGRGSWRLTDYSQEFMEESMKRNLRASGKGVLREMERAANRAKAEDLPWGEEKCRLLYGYGIETYMSM